SRARRGPAVTGERLRMRRRTSGFAPPLQPLSGPGAAKADPRTSELQRTEPAPGTGGAGPSPGSGCGAEAGRAWRGAGWLATLSRSRARRRRNGPKASDGQAA
ncbi:hypothetical protein EI555_000168, partial [Monodon monoceros]